MATQNPEAIALIRDQLNLNDSPSTWSYEQRTRYNNALAAYEVANPSLFPAADPVTVERIANKTYDPLVDDSFSFSDFGNEVLNNANKAVGLGFLTLRNLLFVAVVIFVGFYAFRKAGK